jgi:hypothetical protein
MSSPIPKNSFKSGLSEWGKRTMSAAVGLRLGLFVVLGGCACLGCESAHYVVRGPDRGVVAIPVDTPELRAKAERLMHDQFPGGYVIDDVRVVPLGAPYRTVTRVGPVAEIETHQRHEVMLYYHAGLPAPAVPLAAATPAIGVPSSPAVMSAVQPVSLPAQPRPPDGLPPQPIPVSR